ncbi:Putative Zn-dependent protease, contains TPR repeats [Kingella potus]|uniref:Zn-dependent protease, contains TPR repeats n=1 Tax=Kingella potus TaxID=265175 RepID=A0A377R493_9NEIS|nr:tetratricopeptide repeat protein [Kingella potus]UOP00007.1 tetratricopeptide repeat protein [Kingella potus]STR03296.1 Putative Zn-dependent protease, contains TPR repeats [Kingella potus]
MKKILAAILLASFGIAFAAPYLQHNVKQSVLAGQRFNGPAADKIFNDLAGHAGNYPVRFDNAADQKRAARDAGELLNIFRALIETDIVKPSDGNYLPMLHHTARLAWIAHNLDVQGAAQTADGYYRKLLSVQPQAQRAQTLGEYGSFLASANQPDAALRMLRQAVDGGNAASRKTLAAVLLTKGQKEQALREIRAYVKQYPQDGEAKRMLEAVQSGRVEVKRVPMGG